MRSPKEDVLVSVGLESDVVERHLAGVGDFQSVVAVGDAHYEAEVNVP